MRERVGEVGIEMREVEGVIEGEVGIEIREVEGESGRGRDRDERG